MTSVSAQASPISHDGRARASRPVIVWLYVLAGLVALMILVGGATRLTESGLSITEWQLVTGTVPPLTSEAWTDAFEKYKQIPQYKIVNEGMSLDEFKAIYWWEWSHRFLGRFIGIAFLLPFLVFWIRGMIPARLYPRLGGIFLLGAAQGALGWFMVMSGLVARTEVSQYRLAAHLGLAFLILAAILWTVFRETGRGTDRPGAIGRRFAGTIVCLAFLQILLGALVAGLDAGLTFNTWPQMDGRVIPGDLLAARPWYVNFFENVKTVQFDHRMIGYLLWVCSAGHALRLYTAGSVRSSGAVLLALLVTCQAAVGIWTLLAAVPISLGIVHQAGAVIVFSAAVHHFAGLSPIKAAAEAR